MPTYIHHEAGVGVRAYVARYARVFKTTADWLLATDGAQQHDDDDLIVVRHVSKPRGAAKVHAMSTEEGVLVDMESIEDPNVREAIRRSVIGKQCEIWKLNSPFLDAAGYLPGDYLIVDLKATPRAGNIVLAYRHRRTPPDEGGVPIFRLLFPPNLVLVTTKPWPADINVEVVGDDITVRGVVILKIR